MQLVNKNILLILVSVFLISIVSAQLVFQQSTESELRIVCINAGYCSAATVCNVSVFDPDNLVLLDGVQATQATSLAFYNVTLNTTNTAKLGEYQVGGFCKDGSVTQLIDFTFDITLSGKPIDTSRSIIYVILFLGSLFLFILCLWGGMVLPFRNKRAEAGNLIGVELSKYPKVGLLFLSYVFLIWLINLLFALANNFNTLQSYQSLFRVIFGVLNSFSYPLFVIMLIFIMVLAIKDLKLKKLLDRGLNVSRGLSR